MSAVEVNRGLISKPGEGQPLPGVGRVRIPSAYTGGELEAIELGTPPGGGGPPPHIHHEHDECFYILEGTYTFVLGNQEIVASTGSVVFVPRGMRHGFKAAEGSRALVTVTPAGMEGFFRELGAGLMAGRPEAELRAELEAKYDSHPADIALRSIP
jgi:quercetin dioxygenase-like cupin family protein